MNYAIITFEIFKLKDVQDYNIYAQIFLEYINQLRSRSTDKGFRQLCKRIIRTMDEDDISEPEEDKLIRDLVELDAYHRPQLVQTYTRDTIDQISACYFDGFQQLFVKMYSNVKFEIYISINTK